MPMSRFDRSLLPPPQTFYFREIGPLGRADRKGWCKCACPFHESKSKKSFNVNLDHGGWVCFGCGAKGGDVVSFLQKRDGLSFQRAAELLGAWRDMSAADRQRAERDKRDREQKRLADEAREAECKRDRIAARSLLHALERLREVTSRELCALEKQSPGVETREKERCFATLCLLTDEIRSAEQRYFRLAGIEVSA